MTKHYYKRLDSLKLDAILLLEKYGEERLKEVADMWTLTFTSQERKHALGEIDKLICPN